MEYCGKFNLKHHSTLHIGPLEAHAVYIDAKEDIEKAFKLAQELTLIPYPLGGGSNTVFDNNTKDTYLFLIPRMNEVCVISERPTTTSVRIDAGVPWDKAVEKIVALGLAGLESLSGIPGLTGSAPVQNIGAYGAEVKDAIETVYAYDAKNCIFVEFTKDECTFGYRDSIFKKNPGRYFIYSVTFNLSKLPPTIPQYKDVAKYFEEHSIVSPSLLQIREAILSIRKNKLPDPQQIPNAGSYFKNPVINQEKYLSLKEKFPDISSYPTAQGEIKIFAGWLIDKAGLKGMNHLNFGIHKNHALILIGNGNGTLDELLACEEKIKQHVFKLFGIMLEREPVIVS